MNTETKKPSEIQALIIRLLPPEEFREDANVEELYNRVTDMETEVFQMKEWKANLLSRITIAMGGISSISMSSRAILEDIVIKSLKE